MIAGFLAVQFSSYSAYATQECCCKCLSVSPSILSYYAGGKEIIKDLAVCKKRGVCKDIHGGRYKEGLRKCWKSEPLSNVVELIVGNAQQSQEKIKTNAIKALVAYLITEKTLKDDADQYNKLIGKIKRVISDVDRSTILRVINEYNEESAGTRSRGCLPKTQASNHGGFPSLFGGI